MEKDSQITYADAGVDIQEGAHAVRMIKDCVASTYRREVVGDLGGFGGLFSIKAAASMEDPILVSGTDGVGTKLKIAQRFGIHNTIGIDLVAMCVNDILATGAEPLFFLDYIAIGKLDSHVVNDIVAGIAEGCKSARCSLIGGEMAEHPGVMHKSDYDVSGFAVGLVDRPLMLDPAHVREGDCLIALPSSGIHSNGYSLVRKVCVDPLSDEELLQPQETLHGRSLVDAFLEPTRIYVSSVLSIINQYPLAVRSIAHITGGGISENLNRALNAEVDAVVDPLTWTIPPIIKHVVKKAQLSDEEAFKTFNMGVGMVLIVDPAKADEILLALRAFGEDAFIMGAVCKGSGSVLYQENCLHED